MKGSRTTSEWNLYQAYFPGHHEEELQHCGLQDGTDSDCWPSFQTKYGNNTKAVLQAALELDRVHCAKLEKLNQEGVEKCYQTFAIVVGDCVQKDQGLGMIVATPGLTDFVSKHLKLDNETLLGLIKCKAYNAVSKRITEDINPEKLVNELNKAFDLIEAELKLPPDHLTEK
ncbi:hypothetical protein J132_10868 [Termitomyces sp. J132]|nr:hypothetical protein J132_10868 [Termitomyces sp. J132]